MKITLMFFFGGGGCFFFCRAYWFDPVLLLRNMNCSVAQTATAQMAVNTPMDLLPLWKLSPSYPHTHTLPSFYHSVLPFLSLFPSSFILCSFYFLYLQSRLFLSSSSFRKSLARCHLSSRPFISQSFSVFILSHAGNTAQSLLALQGWTVTGSQFIISRP